MTITERRHNRAKCRCATAERPAIARSMAERGASLAAIARTIHADRKTVHKLINTESSAAA